MIALTAAAAFATDAAPDDAPPDPALGPAAWVVETLAAQIERNVAGLTLPDAPEVYHLRYSVLQLGQVDVAASLGTVVQSSAHPVAALGVEVRVGSPDFDNTGFGGWQNGFARSGLPVNLTRTALATEAWRLTDTAYKQALEQVARKAAQYVPPPDAPPDYTLTGQVVADVGGAVADADAARLTDLAERLSGVLRGTPALVRGEAYVGHEAGATVIVDSEGTRVRTPVHETTIRIVATIRAADGELLTDQRLWTVRGPDTLPPAEEMEAEVAQLRADLVAWSIAPPLDDEYVGPVVFEGTAARDLFRYALVDQLEGTPPEVPFDSWFGELGEARDPVRVGRRVLPAGWSVVDDPRAIPEHPGSYRYDAEGTPSETIALVEDGIARTLAMSRVPRRGLQDTNGHARAPIGRRAAGRLSLTTVEPDRKRSESAVRKAAQKLARAYGRDWIVVVRRLQEPAVLALSDESRFEDSDRAVVLPPPVAIVRRYADGREEPMRGATFAGVHRWVLRDIVAAGPIGHSDYMAPAFGGYAGLGPTEGMPCRMTAPDVLVGEMELVPAPGDPRAIAALPAP